MAYTTAEGREQVLGDLAVAIEQIAESLARRLGEAYEQLDEHTADVLEERAVPPRPARVRPSAADLLGVRLAQRPAGADVRGRTRPGSSPSRCRR